MCFEDVFFSGKNPFKTLSLINEEAVAELSTSEGEKCAGKIFLNLSKHSFPKSESARMQEILGSFSFPPNALILALEVTFSFRKVKRREECFIMIGLWFHFG